MAAVACVIGPVTNSSSKAETNSQEFPSASLIKDSGSWRIWVDRNCVWVEIPDMAKRIHMSPAFREPEVKRPETPWVSIAVLVTYCAALAIQLLQ